jgi:hypothetical protein
VLTIRESRVEILSFHVEVVVPELQ